VSALQRARKYGAVSVDVFVCIDPEASDDVILSNSYALAAGNSEAVCDPDDYPRAVGEGRTIEEAAKAALADAKRLGFEVRT
jgi:hypothetical protein